MDNLKRFVMAGILWIPFMFLTNYVVMADSSFEYRLHEGHLCARNSAWLSARDFSLELQSKGIPGKPSCALQLFENNDMLVRFDGFFETTDGKSGEAILIAGRALLTRNIQTEENYAIDILDGPVLLQQLALVLIDLASEKGPQETIFPFYRKIVEAKYPIKVTTASAGGLYTAPWEAEVKLVRDEKGAINYKIDFSCSSEKGKSVMKLTGQLSNYGEKNMNQPLADDFNIEGWKQYDIGPYTKKTTNGIIFDYGTTYIEPSFLSLRQLRLYIKEKAIKNKEGHNK